MQKKAKISIIAFSTVLVAVVATIAIVALLLNSTDRKIQRYLDLGYRYLEEMDYDEAIAEFKKAIAIDPNNMEAYLGLAEGYMGNGDTDNAIATLQEAIAIYNPTDEDGWNTVKVITVRLASLEGVDATRQDTSILINKLVQAGNNGKADELQKELDNYKGTSNEMVGTDGAGSADTDSAGSGDTTDGDDNSQNSAGENESGESGQTEQGGSTGTGPEPVDMGDGWLIYTQLIVGDNPSQFTYLSTDRHILEDGSEVYIGLLKNSTETAGQINFDSKPEYLNHPYVKLSSFSYEGAFCDFSVEGVDSK